MNEELKMLALIESINSVSTRDNIHAEVYTDSDGNYIIRIENYDDEEKSFDCPYEIMKHILGI